MADIQNNCNLNKLYLAQQKLDAYNTYTKAKNKEDIDETLFSSADVNGDGKITSADKNAITKEINELKKDKLLFDVSGNGKVDVEDLIMFSNGIDFNGDGKVDESELAVSKSLANNTEAKGILSYLVANTTTTQDLNGDGKVDMADLEKFMTLIEGRDIYNSDSAADKRLQDFHKSLNNKLLNFDKSRGITVGDLAYADQMLEISKGYIAGDKKYKDLSSKLLLKSDLDGNNTIDENDVKLIEVAIKSLEKQLNVTRDELANSAANYNALTSDINDLTKRQAEEKKVVDNLKAECNKLKSAITTAQKNVAAADKAVATAQSNIDNYDKNVASLKSYQDKLKEAQKQVARFANLGEKKYKYYIAYWNTQINNYKSKINTLKKATDLKAQKAALEKAKANQQAANEALQTAQNNYDAKQAEYTTAKDKYDQTTTELANKKAEQKPLKANSSLYSTYANYQRQVLLQINQDVAKNLNVQDHIEAAKDAFKTDDQVLQAAFDQLTDEEKVLVYKLDIDITETFEDGSPKYILAKGKQDNQYHIYEFPKKGETRAESLARKYLPGTGMDVIKSGNGYLVLKNKTDSNPDYTIVIPKKVTETTTTTEEVEVQDNPLTEEQSKEVDMNIKELANEFWHSLEETDLDLNTINITPEQMYEIVQAACDAYLHNKIEKDDLSSNIIAQIAEIDATAAVKITEILSKPTIDKTETITHEPEKTVEEVSEEVEKSIGSDLAQTTTHITHQPDLNTQEQQDVVSKIIKNVCKSFLNGEVEKEDITTIIINEVAKTNPKGAETLRSDLEEMTPFGQQIMTLINALISAKAQTEPTTETKTTSIPNPIPTMMINTIEKLISNLIDARFHTEIKTTTETTTKIESDTSNQSYGTASPLSFDLNGDGVKTSSEKVMFDIDGDGKLDLINNSADGVLVFDADGNGIAGENGHEVFGDNTDLDGDGKKDGFANGFDALRALGQKEGLLSDSDNTLDSSDIAKLQEKYSLGIKSGYNGEVKNLFEVGISEINFGESNETQTIKNFDGNNNDLMTQDGATFKMNGETRNYADIWHVKYETEQ